MDTTASIEAIKNSIKEHEAMLEECYRDIERLERRKELIGLRPIQEQSLAASYASVEQEKETIADLMNDLERLEMYAQNNNDEAGV